MSVQTIYILLVDDDELLLKALSRSLNRLYEHIIIVCLQHPEDLENCISEQGEPDIILCEEQLISQSGHDVLSRAKALCPCAIRCLFSANAQKEYQWLVDNTIHFHLIKPFTHAHLKQVIENTLLLKALPLDKITRVKLGQIPGLPCLTASVSELLEALEEHTPNMNKLVEMLNHDPMLVSKLLQIANSAFMGYQSITSDVKDAVVRIGFVALKALITCYETSHLFINKLQQSKIESVIESALQKALMAKSLSHYLKQDSKLQQNLFACCLLSAVGVLTKECVLESSKNINSVSCYALSAYLLTLWGFESELVRAQLVNDVPEQSELSLTLLHAIVEQLTLNKTFDLTPDLQAHLLAFGQLEVILVWYDSL
ncbi:hypothetical protein PSECIP111951_02520 [Pseudoalteromonas holothuriae]|uniref:Response regulator n=1 Tax=Pseudoalteromonas holothuriae TaxID=2963714 RepID=A0ABM9GJH3_9GAMM|nr:HDOD domain-containing protein [Pseudoalteromonas sp. CIP111951]CAH9061588.1 hypothetical protein PSECIP111951_02520 [Pseudoalteromonas sp. CIP111951]